MSAASTAKVPTMWPPSYHKQGSNRSKGHILHLDPLRRKSRRGHKVSPLERPASSSLVVTPVPFALTGDMFFKEASLLGNASFLLKHVSSVSQSASVANVRDAPAVVTGILDLSALKRFLQIKTFKMETPESIRLSLQQGEWVTSLDFSDAYFHIPINQVSRKYLRFHLEDQTLQFQTLPFGLSTAPVEFTIVVKEVKLMVQAKGIQLPQYLDDWLIRSQTKESCSYQTQGPRW